jgi:hypothetical protein
LKVDGAEIVGLNTGVQLVSAGVVPRYGHGDDARRTPPGRRLVAFRTVDESGERDNRSTEGKLIVVVPGQPNRSVSATPSEGTYVVVAVSVGATASVRLDDAGYAQTLSLPAGTPGPANLKVLTRSHRTDEIGKTSTIPVHLSTASAAADTTFRVSAGLADLNFWAPGRPSAHPASTRDALLTVNLTYTVPQESGSFAFDPQLLKLILPGGHAVQARDLEPSATRVFNVFEVPADFTTGTLVVSGSEHGDGVSLSLRAAARFPISIAAG